jgi:hypothetical protein
MKKIYIKKAFDPKQTLLAKFPQVAAQWHPKLNGGLTPDLVTAGSGKKVWWICAKMHEFTREIYTQVRFKNCPFCSGKLQYDVRHYRKSRAGCCNNLFAIFLFTGLAKEL